MQYGKPLTNLSLILWKIFSKVTFPTPDLYNQDSPCHIRRTEPFSSPLYFTGKEKVLFGQLFLRDTTISWEEC